MYYIYQTSPVLAYHLYIIIVKLEMSVAPVIIGRLTSLIYQHVALSELYNSMKVLW